MGTRHCTFRNTASLHFFNLLFTASIAVVLHHLVVYTAMSTTKGNLFTTYGTLRVGVVEASDLVEIQVGNAKKVKVTKSNVFAMLKITDDNGKEEKHCSTETHIFHPSEALIIGEEFLFENVSSAHSLVVSFYSVALEKEKINHAPVTAAQTCLGFTQIPLARLGENTSVNF